MRAVAETSVPEICAMTLSTGPPGANCTMAKLITMIPSSVGKISRILFRRYAPMRGRLLPYALKGIVIDKAPQILKLCSFLRVEPPRVDDATSILGLDLRPAELVPMCNMMGRLVPMRHPVVP